MKIKKIYAGDILIQVVKELLSAVVKKGSSLMVINKLSRTLWNPTEDLVDFQRIQKQVLI